MNSNIYSRTENPEYFDEGLELYHRLPSGDKKLIFTFSEEDRKKTKSNAIFQLLEFDEYIVMIVNWPVYRNILCFRKENHAFVWRVNPPQNIFSARPNYWSSIYKQNDHLENVYCYSVDKYRAAFDLKTGVLAWEQFPEDGNPRDF